MPYQEIHDFIKVFNISSVTGNEKSCLQFQRTTCISKRNLLLNFKNKYLNCITLDITKEYEKRLQSPKEARFKTYKESVDIINSCEACKNYCKDMLRNVHCASHQSMLGKIRTEYFESMKDSWISETILIKYSIFEKILYIAYYKTDYQFLT